MRVAYWQHKRSSRQATIRKARPGYELGTVVTSDHTLTGNVWVRSDRGQIVEVARENLRSAIGHELRTFRPWDVDALEGDELEMRYLVARNFQPDAVADIPPMSSTSKACRLLFQSRVSLPPWKTVGWRLRCSLRLLA